MRIAAVIFQSLCWAYALFLGYQISLALYQQNYEMLEIAADVGTLLICIDLAVFLHFNQSIAALKSKATAPQSFTQVSKLEKITRKLGHLGIMLIICSWIVPKLV
jgi:hypothetical protein